MYNPAFDIYHAIFRQLQLLRKLGEDVVIEIDRLRIWDFYVLFPSLVHKIRLTQEEGDIRNLRNSKMKIHKNPYEEVPNPNLIFNRLRIYQLAAIRCIASYGIIDAALLQENKVRVINAELLNEYLAIDADLSAVEFNVINLMTSHFLGMSLHGPNGLKSRTTLMESKYDA